MQKNDVYICDDAGIKNSRLSGLLFVSHILPCASLLGAHNTVNNIVTSTFASLQTAVKLLNIYKAIDNRQVSP